MLPNPIYRKALVKVVKRPDHILTMCADNTPEPGTRLQWRRITYLLLFFALVALVVLACTPSTRGTARTRGSGAEGLQSRFLVGGWVIPHGESAGPFTKELKAFVISNEEQLDKFLESFRLFRTRGNFESLSNADYGQVVVLAAYYVWLPLKGFPLSLLGVTLGGGTEVRVNMDLEEVPGREAPYLAAPLHIVSVDRTMLTQGVPIDFVFLLNGEEATTVTATLE